MITENRKFLVVLTAVIAGVFFVSVLPGGLWITGHEGDLIHTLDNALRMVAGDKPHQDFMTPLGVLTIAPIALFIKAGFGPGMSILLAQFAVCLCAVPMIIWVSLSRLSGVWRYVFAIGMVLLCTALTYGGDNPSTSLAMYYNRWSWVFGATVVMVLMFPPAGGYTRTDAVVVGMCGAILTLTKVTYVFGLLPFVLIALLNDRAWRMMIEALIVSLIVLLVATVVLGGVAFWQAYALDLLETATSPIRTKPGEDFGALLGKPEHLPSSILMLTAVVFFRKTKRKREGLLLLALFPGFVYITYQNWGNDPFWLFVVMIAMASVPLPVPARRFADVDAGIFQKALILVALTIYSPSIANIAFSTARHAMAGPAEFAPLFSSAALSDVYVKKRTHASPAAVVHIDAGRSFRDDGDEAAHETYLLNGEEMPDCDLSSGLAGWLREISVQLEGIDVAIGKHILFADLLDPLWLFGPFERNTNAAAWFYGSNGGYESAEMVLVPLCPLSVAAREVKLSAIHDKGFTLTEIARTDLFILLDKVN